MHSLSPHTFIEVGWVLVSLHDFLKIFTKIVKTDLDIDVYM